jgi:tetratricopeptide (TPR) repeat protein
LPQRWLEEQVQVLQLLGFLRIAAADAPGAVHFLDGARRVLRGAGAWSEVLQMDVALGSLYQALGQAAKARDLLKEARQLSAQADPSGLAPLIELAEARPLLEAGKAEEAATRCLAAARLLAERGDAMGFVTAVGMLSAVYVRRKMYPEAYRILATGLGIARHLKLRTAQHVLNMEIAHLRDTIVGPERFAIMVDLMLQQARRNKRD